MFGYTIIKSIELGRIKSQLKQYIKGFDTQVERVQQLLDLKDKQGEALQYQQEFIDKLSKNIPHYGWYIADINKGFTDKKLKETLPEGITIDMIEHFIIDRKQGKIAILIK